MGGCGSWVYDVRCLRILRYQLKMARAEVEAEIVMKW